MHFPTQFCQNPEKKKKIKKKKKCIILLLKKILRVPQVKKKLKKKKKIFTPLIAPAGNMPKIKKKKSYPKSLTQQSDSHQLTKEKRKTFNDGAADLRPRVGELCEYLLLTIIGCLTCFIVYKYIRFLGY